MQGMWVITCIGAVIGGFMTLLGFGGGSAPAQAAIFAGACAVAIIPYIFSRAVQGLSESRLEKQLKRIGDLLENQAKSP